MSNPSTALTEREMLEQEYRQIHGEEPTEAPVSDEALFDDATGCVPRSAAEREAYSEAARLQTFRRAVHQSRPQIALCLSGGGIRSATFNLGVLQALAKHHVLEKIHYLSTVSGGGYVGSWLSAWIHRDHQGRRGVFHKLSSAKVNEGARIAAENSANSDDHPDPVGHLRQYSNYLTPRLGLLRADSATLVATYLRNLALNWVVLVPLLMALMLLPRMYTALLFSRTINLPSRITEFTPAVGKAWLLFGGGLCLLSLGILEAIRLLPSTRRRKNRGRPVKLTADERMLESRHIVFGVMLPLLGSAVLLSIFYAWTERKLLASPWESWGIWMAAFCLPALVLGRKRLGGKVDWRSIAACALASLSAGFVAMIFRQAPWLRNFWSYPSLYILFRVPASLALYSVFITMYVGFSSGRPGGDDDREWWARLQGWTLLFAAFWMIAIGIGVLGPWFVSRLFDLNTMPLLKKTVMAISAISSAIGILGGHSDSSSPQSEASITGLQRIKQTLLVACATLAVPFVLILLSWGVNAFMSNVGVVHGKTSLDFSSALFFRDVALPFSRNEFKPAADHAFWTSVTAFCAAIGLLLASGLLMNFNRFSMHALYRDRLVRAYLGASNVDRNADGFTGFDPHDNMPVHHLRRTQRFVPEDFRSGIDSQTRLPVLEDADKDRLWELITLLITSKSDFFDPHLKGLAPAQHEALLELYRSGKPSRDRCWLALERAVMRYLNIAMERPELAEHGRSNPNALPPESPEIASARLALRTDGCPFMLNRLILESQCGELLVRPNIVQVPLPMQVINMALNVVDTPNLAWQQRKAISFTVTPLHCGFENGYRPADEYGGPISLGTAMTISGAAASPNMGYHSSPPVTFLMTLFNVRLGWWLGNPATVQLQWYHQLLKLIGLNLSDESDPRRDVHRRPDPRHSVLPLINEAIGRTDERYPYVYLSDGGHFDNTGLYEMIRRRCRLIVVSDASCDPKCDFEDLANAIRKIEIDMQVPIDMREVLFSPDADKVKDNKYCAVGTIRYSEVDGKGVPDGVLIYLKPALHQRQPVDLYSHGRSSAAFPHDPTFNQWFTEAQFESYRKLGYEIADYLLRDPDDPNGPPPGPAAAHAETEANLHRATDELLTALGENPIHKLVRNAKSEVATVTAPPVIERDVSPKLGQADDASKLREAIKLVEQIWKRSGRPTGHVINGSTPQSKQGEKHSKFPKPKVKRRREKKKK